MTLIDAELTASQVLRVFHRDEIALFLGAAFGTIGLVILALMVIRRRFEALLFWLALFAIFYGLRLWVESELLRMVIPPSVFFDKLQATIDFLVPIPAFLFFEASDFLAKPGRILTYIACGLLFCILVVVLLGGPLVPLYRANNIIVIGALCVLLVQLLRRPRPTRDFRIIRNGVFVFIAFALWNNFGSEAGHKSEPYGFAVFLGCLGYVAARRTQERDEQLSALRKELEVAKRIQLSILPAGFPASKHFRVAARYVPMTSVAGDFYDFLSPQDDKAGLLIADVSGHGVPAALIASMVKVAATSQREHAAHPAKLLTGMNLTLCGNTQNQFVTAAYVHLDAQKGELHYAAAGHPPMLLLRNGEALQVEENGMVLALFASAAYTSTTQALKRGDRLLLYTDGVVEAEDAHKEQFGLERLVAALRETAARPPEEAIDMILQQVEQWSASQDDDRTVLVCDYVGA